METSVTFSAECEYTNSKLENDSFHAVAISVDAKRNYALIEANSREALYELGRSLMEQALYGYGEAEFYPLVIDDEAQVVNGVRLPEGSARLFVHYPKEGRVDG
jgi:hypothetical protein